MEDDPPAAQQPDGPGALQDIVHRVEPLFLFQAAHGDIVGGVLGLLADGQGGFFAHPHTPAALVFKGVQTHSLQVQGHLGAVFVSLLAEAVALAGGAEQNHSSFPPCLKYFSIKGFSSLRRNKIPFLISRVMGCTTSTRIP